VRAVVAAQAGAVVGVVADAVGLGPVVDAALPAAGADRVVVLAARAADEVAQAVADGVKAKAVTATVDAAMVAASSSRT
jgi:hypothetical protein